MKLLQAIVAAICRKTASPRIEYDAKKADFLLLIDPRDQSRTVGKHGRCIGAINTLMWYAGLSQIKRTAGVKLLEPQTAGDRRAAPYSENPKWDRSVIANLLEAVSSICLNGACKAWILESTGEAEATARLRLEARLKPELSDPDFAEALRTIIRSAGMAGGASIKTEIEWA